MAATIPLWDRMTPEQVDKVATLISSGTISVDTAFISVYPVAHSSIWRAIAAGREINERAEGGKRLTEKEERGQAFYLKILQAQSRGEAWLERAALGVEVSGGKVTRSARNESANAIKILLLRHRGYRTPWRDPDELAAIAAHAAASAGKPTEEPPAETAPQPTEAQRIALARKLAAELGYDLTPKAPDAG